MGRIRLDHLQECLDVVRSSAGRRRPRRVRRRAGRRRHLPARLPRGPRDAVRGHAAGLESPTSVPTGRAPPRPARGATRPSAAPRRRARGLAACGPPRRPQPGARRLQRFGLLDDRVRFLQGAYGRDAPERPDREDRAAADRRRARRARPARSSRRLYDQVTPGRVRGGRRLRPTPRSARRGRRRSGRSAGSPTSSCGGDRLGRSLAQAGRDRRPAPGPDSDDSHTPRPDPRPPGGHGPPRAPATPAAATVGRTSRSSSSSTTCSARPRAPCTRCRARYQQDIDDLDYEVIVVENGSAPRPDGSAPTFVRSFGPEFRYLDLGDDGPAVAGPRAQPGHRRVAGGDHIALMIDGAHVLTPGVLRYGMAGLRTYAPAVVATQQWYVGPGQQGDADARRLRPGRTRTGCSSEIGWPADGYRLFEIGHFIGDRDWFDGLWESNCLFVPREPARAGGRLRRELLDARRRLHQPRPLRAARRRPRTSRCVTILGEGSFHQVHGGTTTNQPTSTSARAAHRLLRASTTRRCGAGRFRGPDKPIHYVGGDRTRRDPHAGPVRVDGPEHSSSRASTDGPDGVPDVPQPDPRGAAPPPSSTRTGESLRWQKTTWLGQPVAQAARPTSSSTRSSSPGCGPTGSSRPGPATAAGRLVPGVDLRPARPRPGALGR